MTRLRHVVEHHFGIVLIAACAGGLFLPGLPDVPSGAAVVTLAVLMFLSCYRLRDSGFASLRGRDIGLFYLWRYVLLPPVLWAVAHWLIPAYATGVFLLSMVPAAVSSPAITHLYSGRVPVAFAIVLVSQLLTPLLIPLHFAWLAHVTPHAAQGMPSPAGLFVTMAECIFLPMALYAALRRHRPSADYFYAQSRFFSVLLIAFIIALAIAKQRALILTGGPQLLLTFAVTLVCYAIYMVFGGWIRRACPREERIAYAACSVFNNAALAVSLALLHFGPEVILFVAVSEIGWALLPLMFRLWLPVAR